MNNCIILKFQILEIIIKYNTLFISNLYFLLIGISQPHLQKFIKEFAML